MVQHSPTHFNASFAALADATRRGVLDQLARGDASITALADKFEMTLTGMNTRRRSTRLSKDRLGLSGTSYSSPP